jgi:ketosteroid isomerase-like protein
MSQENVELTYQRMDAFNRRDLAAYLALTDPEIEFTPYEVRVQGSEPYRGHAGVRTWWEESFGVFPNLSSEAYDVRHFGDRTLVHGRLRARGAGSGASIERPMWLVIEWRHKKVVWWSSYESEEEALEAVELSE